MPRKFTGVLGKLRIMLQIEECHLSALFPPRYTNMRTLQERGNLLAILYSNSSQNDYKESVIPNYSHIVPFFHLFSRPFDLPLLQEILQSTS